MPFFLFPFYNLVFLVSINNGNFFAVLQFLKSTICCYLSLFITHIFCCFFFHLSLLITYYFCYFLHRRPFSYLSLFFSLSWLSFCYFLKLSIFTEHVTLHLQFTCLATATGYLRERVALVLHKQSLLEFILWVFAPQHSQNIRAVFHQNFNHLYRTLPKIAKHKKK